MTETGRAGRHALPLPAPLLLLAGFRVPLLPAVAVPVAPVAPRLPLLPLELLVVQAPAPRRVLERGYLLLLLRPRTCPWNQLQRQRRQSRPAAAGRRPSSEVAGWVLSESLGPR